MYRSAGGRADCPSPGRRLDGGRSLGNAPSDGLSQYFVYVLLNDAGIAYTGIAKDVTGRLAQHNGGTGARFTRGRGPWRVLHTEGPMPHGDALRREMAIKRDRAFKTRLKASA